MLTDHQRKRLGKGSNIVRRLTAPLYSDIVGRNHFFVEIHHQVKTSSHVFSGCLGTSQDVPRVKEFGCCLQAFLDASLCYSTLQHLEPFRGPMEVASKSLNVGPNDYVMIKIGPFLFDDAAFFNREVCSGFRREVEAVERVNPQLLETNQVQLGFGRKLDLDLNVPWVGNMKTANNLVMVRSDLLPPEGINSPEARSFQCEREAFLPDFLVSDDGREYKGPRLAFGIFFARVYRNPVRKGALAYDAVAWLMDSPPQAWDVRRPRTLVTTGQRGTFHHVTPMPMIYELLVDYRSERRTALRGAKRLH